MKVIVPVSWEHITIKQFTELQNLKLVEQDAIDYLVEVVMVCCNLTYKEAAAIPITELRKVYDRMGFISEMPSTKVVEKYELEGITYLANWDISKISAGQYIDIKEASSTEAIKNIHNIMAALYIPKGEKYGDSDTNAIADKFYNTMPITVAYPLAVFFCNLLGNSMPAIRDCLQAEAMEKTRRAIQEVAEREQ